MSYEAMEKLSEWFASEHDLKRQYSMVISDNITTKWKQVNENTKIVNTEQMNRLYLIHDEPYIECCRTEYETKITRKEVLSKEYRTFPLIAPYLKPKKTWIMKETQAMKTNYDIDERTIGLVEFRYSYEDVTVRLFTGYDAITDTLFMNCKTGGY